MKSWEIALLLTCLWGIPVISMAQSSAEDVSRLRIEETIKANKAQPQVISILPWQPPKYRNIEGILEWQPKASSPQRLERQVLLQQLHIHRAWQGAAPHLVEQNLN